MKTFFTVYLYIYSIYFSNLQGHIHPNLTYNVSINNMQ